MRIMYLILNLLYSTEARSKLIALTQKEIIEALADDGESWNERTIYNKLRELEKNNYVGAGFKKGNAKTFFIRPEGIAWMEDAEREVNE